MLVAGERIRVELDVQERDSPSQSRAISPPTQANGASITCRSGNSTVGRNLSGVLRRQRKP
jgi:hypothetical protein